jgi:hypothetical protein
MGDNSTLPSSGYGAVVPNDSGRFPACRALYVGISGDVNVVRPDGIAVLFQNVSAGSILPTVCIGVMATGTNASGIVFLD